MTTFWKKAGIGGAATVLAGGGMTAWHFTDPKGFIDFWTQNMGNLNLAQVSGIAVGGAAFIGAIAVIGYMAYQSWKEAHALTASHNITRKAAKNNDNNFVDMVLGLDGEKPDGGDISTPRKVLYGNN